MSLTCRRDQRLKGDPGAIQVTWNSTFHQSSFPESIPISLARSIRSKTSVAVRGTSNRAGKKLTLAAAWPNATEWHERKRFLAARVLRRLGIEPGRPGEGSLSMSQALKVLGPDSFAEFAAVRAAGKVIWCNFDLARQLGFAVPRSNHLTVEFHDQLLSLSLRAVAPGDDVHTRETITMYADKYGGDGLGPALGAGRAGFLPHGNLYVKGIGFTPLFKHNAVDDFAHSHGGVHLDDCLVEAVFGEVNENLFVQGSSRIVAIIDQGKYVTDPSGRRIPIGIAVRTGAQLRPAHLLTRLRNKLSQLDKFIDITRASGQLVTRTNASTDDESPDIKATMLRIIDDHAQTAAEGFRWRMIHGALSASNMEISGAMLDLPTQSTQPRTAPVWLLDYADSIFGSEHTARARHLAPLYRKLIRNVPETDWDRLHIGPLNFRGEMADAYTKHLQVQLLSAAGLKKDLARRIQAEHTHLARSFTELIVEMSALKNRGALCVARAVVEHVAVLDVFNLLGAIPEPFFASPAADHRTTISYHLTPVFRGNRFHVAKKQATVKAAVERFAGLYRELMKVSARYANEYYGELKNMPASIAARAAFENEPLDCLYSHKLFSELRRAIGIYKSTGNPEVIREAVDQRITASLRSVDALLDQGNSRLLGGRGIELEMRTIDGINYSVKAWNDEKQTRLLHVGIPVKQDGVHYVASLPALLRLTKRQVESLRYSFTTDGWKTSGAVRGRLVHDECDGLVISFDVTCTLPLAGRLEGDLCLSTHGKPGLKDRRHDLKAYVFVIPDQQELDSIVTRPWQ